MNTPFSYNYKTGQYVAINYSDLTDEQLLEHMPQHPAVEGIFRCHRALGKSSIEAMIETLTACLPSRKPDATETKA